MLRHLRIILPLILLAVATVLYLLISAPDYGDINVDGLALGNEAFNRGDYDKAAAWFALAAKKGDKNGQYRYGLLYREGRGVDRDDIQAVRWLKLAAAQHLVDAEYELAGMLEHGRGVDAPDRTGATRWYRQSAEAGHAGAQLHLAMIYAGNKRVKGSLAKALSWAMKAEQAGSREATAYVQKLLGRIRARAEAGDAEAQFILARLYEQGQGVQSDSRKAEQWLQQSADRGNREAQFHLAELFIHRDSSAFQHQAAELYLKAAAAGHVRAEARAGLLYMLGKGVAVNPSEAIRWLRKAAEKGNAKAQSDLGIVLMHAGKDTEAIQWLQKAAEAGISRSQNNLGVLLALGRGQQKDLKAALKWLSEAAQTDTLAQYNLGLLYIRGVGVMQDEEKGAKWLISSEKLGVEQASLLLGLLYDMGVGVIVSFTEAERWYRTAIDSGNEGAVFNLAALYYRKNSFNLSFEQFKHAAEAGDRQAQNIVAVMYLQGQGVDVDPKKALYWLQQSARSGYPAAQFNLGNLYRKGDSAEQQDSKAAGWYRKSAKQGFAAAENALGYMYAQGRGVDRNIDQAARWFDAAARHGLTIAQQNLSLLRPHKRGFTLTCFAVDIQRRSGILTENPFDLKDHLMAYQQPEL